MNRRGAAWFGAAMLSAIVVPAASAASVASNRTAVFIASGAGTDPALGDNLNEVAIAKLAERSSGERVGTHEMRRWIEKSGNAESVPACISNAPCLHRLGADLGVRKLISGSVLADGPEFTIALTLVDADSGAVEATSVKTVSGDLEQVIQTVQDAVVELLHPRTAAPRLELTAPQASSAVVLTSGDPATGVERRRGWPFYTGIGAASAAVLSLSAAGVFGILAREEPTGATRAEMQRDLDTRDAYASTANTLFIVSGALGAAAMALLVWQRGHFGGW